VATSVTVTGTGSSNYTVASQAGLTQNITAKALTVAGLTANNKVYDSTTTATLSGTAALQSSESAGSGTTSDGTPYTGDTVSVIGTPSGTFASANAGNNISVSVSGLSLTGGQATDYSLTAPSLSANITQASTISAISASTNISPPGATLGLTNAVSVVSPGAGTPTGTIQFYTNGVAYGPAITISGGLAILLTNALPHAAYSITAQYAGDNNFITSSSGSTNILIDNPPAIGTSPINYGRTPGTSLRIRVASLLASTNANVTDADGDSFSVTSVGNPAVSGASTLLSGSFILYTPASSSGNVNDSFTYTVTDSLGAPTTGIIDVVMTNQTSTTLSISSCGVNCAVVSFQGLPNYTYILQRSSPSSSGPFSDIYTNTAAPNGLFQYTDNPAPNPSFYRVRLP